jgi:ribonuclease HI
MFIEYDIYHLAKSGINIIFEWIPSHVGLQGNELADLEAKKALTY